MKSNKAFAEIIESSLHGWLAQSWQWDKFPTFGSLIGVSQKERLHIGIVYQVSTGSMDPMRYPFPYQKTEEELLEEQPQIFEFLKTTFSCLSIGYYEKGKIKYHIAPQPARIHAFVEPLDPQLHKQFLTSPQVLHALFAHSQQIANMDELLLTLFENQIAAGVSQKRIHAFLQTYSLLIGNDYRRTKLFLQRVQHVTG